MSHKGILLFSFSEVIGVGTKPQEPDLLEDSDSEVLHSSLALLQAM